MAEETRGYESPLRREQARVTQARIVAAAHELLVAQGWAATTMAAVARAAGVSAQTVYKAFGSKSALVKRVYDVTLVGDDEAVPFAQRPEVLAAYAETDPRRFLQGYADLGRMLLERLGPLLTALTAARSEPEIAELLATTDRERLVGTSMAVARVAELGGLRPGLTQEAARDAIWALNSVEVWDLLVHRRGWTAGEYAAWVGRAMGDAVVGGP